MSLNDERERRFATTLLKGQLAELLFERLSNTSGWHVQYSGLQYKTPLPPDKDRDESWKARFQDEQAEPDFEITKPSAKPPQKLRVEVKYAHDGVLDRSRYAQKNCDYVVIFSDTAISAGKKEDLLSNQSPVDLADVSEFGFSQAGVQAAFDLFHEFKAWKSPQKKTPLTLKKANLKK